MRNALLLGAAVLGAGCAAPQVTPLRHDEGAIQGFQYGGDDLAHVALADGIDRAAFDLGELAPGRAFDRVGVLWESLEAGGGTEIELAVDGGTFRPVVLDFQEFVPATGVTLFAGHVDVPATGSRLAARVTLFREQEANSPRVSSLRLETFRLAQVAEAGGPVDPAAAGEDGVIAYGMPDIVTRAQWGARPPKCDGSLHDPYRMTFHETVTTNGETGEAAKARMRQMQAFHQDSRGWCDIGYHFSVDAAGVIYRGRTTTARTGSHVGGQNTGNLGISLMGTYETVAPPDAQLEGLMDAFAWLAGEWDITVDAEHVRGHQEWPGQSTSCPGAKVLPKKSLILSGITLRLEGTPPPPPPPPPDPIIVDNRAAAFGASDAWWTSTSQADLYGTDYKVRATAEISDLAGWEATLAGGSYEVFVWYSQGANRASAAPYFVHHQGGTTKVLVDQRVNGGRWVSLGTYAFAPGTARRVALSCWTSSGTYVIADAVKLEAR